MTALHVITRGPAVIGLCGACGQELGKDGIVLLPEDPAGDLHGYCGSCLAADPEAAAAAPERGVDFFEAFLLLLVVRGCAPRSVEGKEAA
jgi:hypothetical protein